MRNVYAGREVLTKRHLMKTTESMRNLFFVQKVEWILIPPLLYYLYAIILFNHDAFPHVLRDIGQE